MTFEKISRSNNKNAAYPLTKIGAKMSYISCQEMTRPGFDSGEHNRRVLLGQCNPMGRVLRRSIKQLQPNRQSSQPFSLNFIGQVDSRFFQGVGRGTKLHVL